MDLVLFFTLEVNYNALYDGVSLTANHNVSELIFEKFAISRKLYHDVARN